MELVGCAKRFGETSVLRDVSFGLRKGESLSLLGPSGCGKTTTLRLIAGFLTPDAGDVFIRGGNVTHVPAHLRNVGMVFQNYALWPHMTVFENVAFGLRLRKLTPRTVETRATAALTQVQLNRLRDRYPTQLSGGEQQRVALARALAIDPSVLLLDEPLSNLDRKLREEMRVELKALQQDLKLTSLYVTHDQEEALSMSDRIVVMNNGEIQQIGTPRDIYERPVNKFVAGFVGHANFLEGVVLSLNGDRAVVRLPSGQTLHALGHGHVAAGSSVMAMIRPERIRITTAPPLRTAADVLTGQLRQIVYEGATLRYIFSLSGRPNEMLFAHGVPDQPPPGLGDDIYAEVLQATVILG